MKRSPLPGRQRGAFTVIELMVTVAVLGILAAAAVPGFNELIKNNRRSVLVNELLANVMLARAEAARRGQPVAICPNTAASIASCAGGTAWDYGWMMFVDVNGNGAVDSNVTVDGVTYNENNLVLKYFRNGFPRFTVRASTASGIVVKAFNQSGSEASVTVCDDRGARKARVVCVAASGAATSQETACTTGAALTCP